MSQKTFNLITGILFAVIVVVHALRLTMGWSLIIGSWAAPIWLSWIGCVVAAALSYSGFRLYLNRP